MDRFTFGKRFAAALADREMPQYLAARLSGRPNARISEYASGVRMPPLDTVDELITTLDLDPRILFPEWFAIGRHLDSVESRKRLRPPIVSEVLSS